MSKTLVAAGAAIVLVATGLPVAHAAVEDSDRPSPNGLTASLPDPEPGAEVVHPAANGRFEVTGGGAGPGYGMSHAGANGGAQEGLDHTEILDFYYPGTDLVTQETESIDLLVRPDEFNTPGVDGLTVTTGTTSDHELPDRERWRAEGPEPGDENCQLEGFDGDNWVAYEPEGNPTPCPITFSTPDKVIEAGSPEGPATVYRGDLSLVKPSSSPRVEVVSTLPVDAYLRSAVATELPDTIHPEALQAHAISLRSLVFSDQTDGRTGNTARTCRNTSCPPYQGMGVRDPDGTFTSFETEEADAAVEATTDQLLTYGFGDGTAPAYALSSPSNGGHSAPDPDGHDYLVAQEDPYDAHENPQHSWSVDMLDELQDADFDIGRVERIQILSRDGHGQWGGRITQARIEGFDAAGEYRFFNVSGTELITIFGFRDPGTDDRVTVTSTYLTFADLEG